jgi:glycosyltransferase involved in cell wall biosynthesis
LKVYFDNVSWEAEHTGPNCFAKRLAIQLGYAGITVADPDDYDVALVFIEPTTRLDKRKPFVQRLDGFWMKPEQMASGMNGGIKHCYEQATCVVWQSDFDRKMSLKHFGAKEGVIIRNGIEIKPSIVRSEQLIEMRAKYDKIFVCSANWHPQKRLRDNVEVFRHIRANQYQNSCLIVLGNNPDYHVADKGIFYTGSIRHDLCAEVYSIADWMIHMAYLDHAPNVVVEAIAQGCPVLCASNGGTREQIELAEGNGIVIKEEQEFDYSLVDYDNPPRISLNSVPYLTEMRAQPCSVDIIPITREYEKILRSCLKR